MEVRRAIARSLERGQFSGPLARTLARAWQSGSASRVVRRLALPEHSVIIAIGGSTLGGSGKTPLSLACTRFLLGHGTGKVALIGHAYRAAPGHARVVRVDDDPRIVGDEALVCARELVPIGGEVIVAPARQAAIDLAAARGARAMVLDGVAQTAPRRADLALLALDPDAPWGSGACPPCGDLRADPRALLDACDRVVVPSASEVQSDGVIQCGTLERATYAELRELRLGLFTALARPERIVTALKAHGVFPQIAIHAADHGGVESDALGGAVRTHRLDAWVTTHKCAIHLRNWASIPVYAMEHRLELSTSLQESLASVLFRRGLLASVNPPTNVARP